MANDVTFIARNEQRPGYRAVLAARCGCALVVTIRGTSILPVKTIEQARQSIARPEPASHCGLSRTTF